MKFSQDFIDKVRESIDIVEYIQKFIQLKKRGKNFLGLCPFHNEKTPSFNVSQDKQLYYCFGCGKGGSIFNFIEEYEKIPFPEAVELIANRCGIPIPIETKNIHSFSEYDEMHEVMLYVGKIFHEQLVQTKEGKIALDYLEKRGITKETIKKFNIGYSPKSWNFFSKKIDEEKISLSIAEKCGLVRKKENSYYDYFRGRIMFPIYSITKKIVGFSARKLYDDDTMGKYINSPETLIYNKSKILFGLSHTKNFILQNEYAIVVEGNLDLITLFQEGIENVVAVSGTALTEEHLKLLSRYSKKVILAFDFDEAGINATIRSLDLFFQKNFEVGILRLKKNYDPDLFIREFGKSEFEKRLHNPISVIDFIYKLYSKGNSDISIETKTKIVHKLLELFSKIPDDVRKNFYLKEISSQFSLSEETLKSNSQNNFITTEREVLKNKNLKITHIEKDIFYVLIEGSDDLVKYICHNLPLEEISDDGKKIFHILYEEYEDKGEIHIERILENTQDESVKKLFNEILFQKISPSKNWEKKNYRR